jgi:hypothetical protein
LGNVTIQSDSTKKIGFLKGLQLALLAGILFFVFSFAPVQKLFQLLIKNPILCTVVLALAVIVLFFIIQRIFIKSV